MRTMNRTWNPVVPGMTREYLTHLARTTKAAGHACIDRDWCTTTGETGCGVIDEQLMHLRNAWRAAPHNGSRQRVVYRDKVTGIKRDVLVTIERYVDDRGGQVVVRADSGMRYPIDSDRLVSIGHQVF